MTAAPFAMTQTVTRALAAASTDLGAGDLRAAQTDFTTILEAGLTESQTRITKDQNNIGAALARLVGMPSTTTSQTGAANSVTEQPAPWPPPRPPRRRHCSRTRSTRTGTRRHQAEVLGTRQHRTCRLVDRPRHDGRLAHP